MIEWNGERIKKLMRDKIDNRLEILGVDTVSQATLLAPYKSGRLKGSLTYATKNQSAKANSPAKSNDAVEQPQTVGVVRIGTNVVYAAMQEFGGVIRPVHKKALKFKVDGHWVTTQRVTLRGWHYLTQSIQMAKDKVKSLFSFNL